MLVVDPTQLEPPIPVWSSSPPSGQLAAADVVMSLPLLDDDGGELSFFNTISTFGTEIDVALAELSIEAFYPANAHAAARLLRDIGADPDT